MYPYTVELPATLHREDLLREAAARRRRALLPRRPVRERLARWLVVLAVRLAPSVREAPLPAGRQRARAGRVAATQ